MKRFISISKFAFFGTIRLLIIFSDVSFNFQLQCSKIGKTKFQRILDFKAVSDNICAICVYVYLCDVTLT